MKSTFAAVIFFFFGVPLLHAQVISSTEIERGLVYPGASALGYESPSQRYSYKTGDFIYANGDRRQLIYLDYLDRLDRAQKFGYRIPADPLSDAPPVVTEYPESRGLLGFGFFRRR